LGIATVSHLLAYPALEWDRAPGERVSSWAPSV
jgi:hypothetical protein